MESIHLLAISTAGILYGLQIRVGCLVSQNSQHRDDLALVVKCVGDHMQQDKSRTPQSPAQLARRSTRVALSCSSVRFSK